MKTPREYIRFSLSLSIRDSIDFDHSLTFCDRQFFCAESQSLEPVRGLDFCLTTKSVFLAYELCHTVEVLKIKLKTAQLCDKRRPF